MLFAAAMAWKSPVKWRFRSSIGTTWVSPPPAAPPLIPKMGPSEGSRRHSTGRLPIRPMPWVSETEVVVLPSPAFVGVMADTHTTFAFGTSASRSIAPRLTFALYLPYRSTSSSSRPASRAMSMIGRRTASWAISRLLFTLAPYLGGDTAYLVGYGGGAALRDQLVLVEAGQPERGYQVGGGAGRGQLGHGLADDRRGLEAVGAPAGVDQEAVHLGHAHHRRVVGGDVAQARPLPQDARVPEHRQQLDHVHREILDEAERALVGVAGVGLDLGAHHELAAVGLRDVDVQRPRDDDLVQERLHRLGHARLEDVRGERQRHPGHARDLGAPARDARDDRVASDRPAVGLHPGHAAVLPRDPGHPRVGVDLDAQLGGLLRVAPDHGVVADDAARRVVERCQDREGRVVGRVQLRAQLLDLVRVDHAGIDPEQPVHL